MSGPAGEGDEGQQGEGGRGPGQEADGDEAGASGGLAAQLAVRRGKRTALRQLVTSAAFAVPVLVSFSMNGLNAAPAINTYATNTFVGNQTF